MDTKEKILRATLDLAGEKGLGSVSLSQIAAQAGIRKASLYSHFASKDAIIAALYTYLREKARAAAHVSVDYGRMLAGHSAVEVLRGAVGSYQALTLQPEMRQFYRFIEAERVYSAEAARIMVKETQTMILATKQLFYAMQVHGLVHCDAIDTVATAFALTVHSFINYEADCRLADIPGEATPLDEYILEFCRIYGTEESV